MRIPNPLVISMLIGLTSLATAQAEITPIDLNAVNSPVAVPKVGQTSIYIVQMKGNPVVSYGGNIAGYKATKPGKGKKINPKSAHVRKYATRLKAQQNQLIDNIGATKVYNYLYSLNGFAARMTEADAEALKNKADVVNVWKDKILQLQTDSSPAHIGLTEGGDAWSKGYVGEDVVIGVIDSGVWPEHPSFADVPTFKKGNKGSLVPYGPIPSGFTPSGCDFGSEDPIDSAFDCNNKLVAARCYNLGLSTEPDASNPCGGNGFFHGADEFRSARDKNGHGSHVASTAGGNSSVPAEIGGEFRGNISGIAPRARIAIYKSCWSGVTGFFGRPGCAVSDSAAAIEQAVVDGVDVINYSVGGPFVDIYYPDDLAFLYAADVGVFVAVANGNSGPSAQTIGQPAFVPWVTSVGATNEANNSIASFSSRGPSEGALDIIKPDVSAPGVAILAAGPGGELFRVLYGTSMASPHVAGAFALLKQAHPDWSPAMAKSALMTTARQDLKKSFIEVADPFDIGAGEILPSEAFDPGLAYDAGLQDYLAFTCGTDLPVLFGSRLSDMQCADLEGAGFPTDGRDLNLASIGIADLVDSQTITRTVTSVANNNGKKKFKVSVDAPPGIDVSVSPSTIKLKSGESASYEVTFTVTDGAVLDVWAFGSLTWSHDEEYFVRSPIAVRPMEF